MTNDPELVLSKEKSSSNGKGSQSLTVASLKVVKFAISDLHEDFLSSLLLSPLLQCEDGPLPVTLPRFTY